MIPNIFQSVAVLFFLIFIHEGYSLRCYHCDHPARQIARNLWIHKTLTCARKRPVECSPRAVACVVVKVSHPLISFSASGCSEDKFVGCDLHEISSINTTMQRCQCTTSLCNRDLHLVDFQNYNNMPIRNFSRAHHNNSSSSYQINLLNPRKHKVHKSRQKSRKNFPNLSVSYSVNLPFLISILYLLK